MVSGDHGASTVYYMQSNCRWSQEKYYGKSAVTVTMVYTTVVASSCWCSHSVANSLIVIASTSTRLLLLN